MMMASTATAPTTIPAIVPVDGPVGLCMLVGDTADVFVASTGGSEVDWEGLSVDAAEDLDDDSDGGPAGGFVELVDVFSVERLVVVLVTVGEDVMLEVVRDVELVVCEVVIVTVVMVGIVLDGLVVVVGTIFDEVVVVVVGVLDGVAKVSSRIQNWPV
jgi:hypothetical protein